MTAYRLHFEPLFLEVLDIVRSGKIGEPRYFSSSFSMHAKPGGIRTREPAAARSTISASTASTPPGCCSARSRPGVCVLGSTARGRTCRKSTRRRRRAAFRRRSARDVHDQLRRRRRLVISRRRHAKATSTPSRPTSMPRRSATRSPSATTSARRRAAEADQFAAELLYFSDCIAASANRNLRATKARGRPRHRRALSIGHDWHTRLIGANPARNRRLHDLKRLRLRRFASPHSWSWNARTSNRDHERILDS